MIVMVLIGFVLVFLTALSIILDEILLFLLAGILAFTLSFEAWTVTANIPAMLSLIVLGLTLMALSVRKLYDVL